MEAIIVGENFPAAEAGPGTPAAQAETRAEELAVPAAPTAEGAAADCGAAEVERGVAEAQPGETEGEMTDDKKRKRLEEKEVQIPETSLISQELPAPAAVATVLKRPRGRPRGSGKLQRLAALGDFVINTAGGKLTPYIFIVQAGQDIVQVIQSLKHSGRAVCVLSATGPASIVDLQPDESFGAFTLRYEGHFEILTLKGSYTLMNTGVGRRRVCMLNISLANPDGSVFGGVVAGCVIAASPVQLILGSFKQSIKKELLMRQLAQAAQPSTAAAIHGNLDTVGVQILQAPIAEMTSVEENCNVTPTSPVPEALDRTADGITVQNLNHEEPNEVADIINFQNLDHVKPDEAADITTEPNLNHDSLQSFNSLPTTEHMSDEAMADIGGRVLDV